MQQRLRQADPLAHALGQVGNVAIGTFFHVDDLKHIIHAVLAVREMAQVGHEFQIFEDGHVRIERDGLGHIPDPPAHFQRLVDNIETGHFCPP